MPVDPTVKTSFGMLSGTETPSEVLKFLGVPYATPPVGSLRFRSPQPVSPWTGVRPAARFSPMAIQPITPMEHALGVAAHPMSEDCLYLNIWTPSVDGRLPVMVWLHGGAFTNGSGSVPWYDGENLARQHQVVVVTLNYRLGVFGFLDLAGYDPETFEGSANAGVLDQKAALEWVRDNIGSFGGDPARVCVFGQSAGAISIAALISIPAAADLFGRAILQSGITAGVVDRDQSVSRTRSILDRLGVERVDRQKDREKLASIPAAELLAAQESTALAHPLAMPFGPAVDGSLLRRQPIEAIRGGAARDIELLVGANENETRLFRLLLPSLLQLQDRRQLVAKASLLFGASLAEEMASACAELLPGASPSEQWETMLDAGQFHANVSLVAQAQTGAGGRCYTYLFAWRSRALGGSLGACHGLELPFVFDNLDSTGAEMLTGSGEDRRDVASMMAAAWTAFARSGRPQADGLPTWTPYERGRPSTMVFDSNPRMADLPIPPWDRR
ncbi:MAG: carboxylesterase/lipase family protein [Actinomycetota bacterium]|nr:carboxylesterase/lipase family protein [Actinomycetota bacterium]